MNTVLSILAQLRNYIRKIYQSTEIVPCEVVLSDLVGRSKTDPYAYGLIFSVMGESLTDLTKYTEDPSEDESDPAKPPLLVNEIEWDDLDEDAVDLENENIPLISRYQVDIQNFENLESCLHHDTCTEREAVDAVNTISRLKGTSIYDSLKNNEAICSRVATLLSNVQVTEEEAFLSDMSDFLKTN